jgi:predicted transcriptional regulator
MEDKILLVLREVPGITTTEIAKKLGASRTTVIQYLRRMKANNIVRYRQVGPAKLWFIADKSRVEVAHARTSAMETRDKLELFLKGDAFFLEIEEEEIKTLKKAKEILDKKSKGIE